MAAHGGTLVGATPVVGLVGHGEVLLLADREVWTAQVGSAGLVVACEAGSVWVTQEGDPEDHVLAPGDRLHLVRRGLVAVQALRTSQVRVARCGRAVEQPALRAASG